MSNGDPFNGGNGEGNGNGKDRELFREYRRLILSELTRLGREQEKQATRTENKIDALDRKLTTKIDAVAQEVSDLKSDFKATERERKVLSSVWGLVGGAIPVLLWMFYQLVQSGGAG